MRKSILLSLVLFIALGVGFTSSWSEDMAMVKQQTPSGIPYVYGGVGEDSQKAMEGIRIDYNFRLTAARPCSGAYLADIKVVVENTESHENVIDVVSGGPLFFAQLPDGKYKVTADFEGVLQNKTITIHKNRPRGVVFYFAEQEEL